MLKWLERALGQCKLYMVYQLATQLVESVDNRGFEEEEELIDCLLCQDTGDALV